MCPAVKAVMEGEVGDSFSVSSTSQHDLPFGRSHKNDHPSCGPVDQHCVQENPWVDPWMEKGEGEVCWEATGAENVWESSLDLINRNSRQPTEGYIERREFVSTKDLILGSLARKDKTLRSSSWRFQVEMIKTSSSHLDLARLECLWRDWEPCCVRNNSLNNS